MKEIYVTITYGMTIQVPENATPEEINRLTQAATERVSSDYMTDYDWEFFGRLKN